MTSYLSNSIQVNRNFLRSVRLDTDFGRADALQGYVLQPSARAALESISHHIVDSQQRAFTWTGPYGGGKSSLALALASLAAGDEAVRTNAKKALGLTKSSAILKCFGTTKPWRLITVVGSRTSITSEIANAIDPTTNKSKPGRKKKVTGSEVIEVLGELASSDKEHEGVLLVIDELGKFLEHAAAHDEDIGFYQEIAEAASRVKGKLVVIGILHQAFEQYASRLGSAIQQEWAKVQGRYVDIPIVASSDETLLLIGKALATSVDHEFSRADSHVIASAVKRRKPSSADNLEQLLDDTWPLHPVTALLLGPISRKKFSQNERSIFSFLASAEPLSLLEHLKEMAAEGFKYYYPSDLWNYLKTNFATAILASPDSHRWVLCADAIERAESKFSAAHIRVVKTIAAIEMFRENSGLAAERDVIEHSIPTKDAANLDGILDDLVTASILIYRKHTSAYGIYAGSDFDIESATTQAKLQLGINEYTLIVQELSLSPVTARRHYWETGAMRWLSRCVVSVDQLEEYASKFEQSTTLAGGFILVLRPRNMSDSRLRSLLKKTSEQFESKGLIIGTPKDTDRIINLASEVAALGHIKQNAKELHGDSVASTEVSGRLQALRNELEAELKTSFLTTKWYFAGDVCEQHGEHLKTLSQIASHISDTIFSQAPQVLSELVNRNDVSSSASKAQRDLLHRMLSHAQEEGLGYEKQSADAGLYATVIHRLGLHQIVNNRIGFVNPKSPKGKTLSPAWQAAEKLLYKPNAVTSLTELYETWTAAPFGIKKGLLPIFALAFFLANRPKLALYVENIFIPELTDAYLDEWLQDPRRVTWRFVQIDGQEKALLSELSKALRSQLGTSVALDPLDSARALVGIVFNLPLWVRRTDTVSNRAKTIRRLLLTASDPHKVLFQDLPLALDTTNPVEIAKHIGEITQELRLAYSNRLQTVEAKLFQALDENPARPTLRKRADSVKQVAADFKLDAFAARLGNYDGELKDIEGLLMLAIGKPAKDWTDHDLNAGEIQLMKWAFEFRRIETLSHHKGVSSTRRAIGIVFSGAETVSGEIDVSIDDQSMISSLANELMTSFAKTTKPEVLLAAIAEAGAKIYTELELRRSEKENG
jgi:hypothetical protein